MRARLGGPAERSQKSAGRERVTLHEGGEHESAGANSADKGDLKYRAPCAAGESMQPPCHQAHTRSRDDRGRPIRALPLDHMPAEPARWSLVMPALDRGGEISRVATLK